VLAGRFEQPGIIEAAGALELQHDGFRAERARPYAFFVTPGRNASRADRLARRYRAEVVRVSDADALLAWCKERGLGLDERTIDDLLGPENESERRRSQRLMRRRDALRIAAAVALSAAVVAAAWALEGGSSPVGHRICGRTGCFKLGCPQPAARTVSAGPRRTVSAGRDPVQARRAEGLLRHRTRAAKARNRSSRAEYL
jgi:hypothetical protein